jgi:hypothetical protein
MNQEPGMKSILPTIIAPLILTALFILILVNRLLPVGRRSFALGICAMLLSMLPAGAEEGSNIVKCYRRVIIKDTATDIMKLSSYGEYRKVYLDLLDYMASGSYQQTGLEELLTQLDIKKKNLFKEMASLEIGIEVINAINEGMTFQAETYRIFASTPNCYEIPKVAGEERKTILSQVVKRQVEVRKLLKNKDLLNDNITALIHDSLFSEYEKSQIGLNKQTYEQIILDLTALPSN